MKKNTTDKLIVLSAPSATGKTTIIERLIKEFDGSLVKVVTCTTRTKREGESQGIDYRFLTKPEFKKYIQDGLFIEYSQVYNYLYGVLRRDIEAQGTKIISLDSKGVANFRKLGVVADYILIKPPSMEELKRRLEARGSENSEQMKNRLDEAEKELQSQHLFDHVVINDDLEKAVEECIQIIRK